MGGRHPGEKGCWRRPIQGVRTAKSSPVPARGPELHEPQPWNHSWNPGTAWPEASPAAVETPAGLCWALGPLDRDEDEAGGMLRPGSSRAARGPPGSSLEAPWIARWENHSAILFTGTSSAPTMPTEYGILRLEVPQNHKQTPLNFLDFPDYFVIF